MTATIENQHIVYKVRYDDDDDDDDDDTTKSQGHNIAVYTLRGLHPDELNDWARFCASVFSYKAHPPSADYFHRHFVNDPDHGPTSLIRVATVQNSASGGTERIVASCRIFLRALSFKSSDIIAGGIGEVCTHPDHRRRGLSRALLHNAIDIMKERRLTISCLHAGPAFFPLYQSCGYVCSSMFWKNVSVDISKLRHDHRHHPTSKYTIRPVIFPQDTEQLYRLHQVFSENYLTGCIIRSETYWNMYLSQELKETLFVLVTDGGRIASWLSLKQRGSKDHFQMQEFGVDRSNGDISVAVALRLLLAHTLSQDDVTAVSSANTVQSITLSLPEFVAQNIVQSKEGNDNEVDGSSLSSFMNWSSAEIEIDHGWMYLSLDDKIDVQPVLSNGTDPLSPCHFLWPSDSF